MAWSDRAGRVLVVAPHPDDEVLGCGGTMARIARAGGEVHVAIMTRGSPPRFDPAQVAAVEQEAAAAHAVLGVARTHWHDFPAAALDRAAHADLNGAMAELVRAVAPDTVFLPFGGDVHLDHQLVFLSGLVAVRPNRPGCPSRVYAYETLSETNWNAPAIAPPFVPTLFVDISDEIERKIEAFGCFASQVRALPDERSPEALRALALLRGATVHRRAAEAFMVVREIG